MILIGTGSEVQLAVAAREQLAAEGIRARVVSMPCLEWFAEQDDGYRAEVLPPAVRARVSVEAAVGQGWREFVGDAGRIVSLEHYGASADYATLYREFGITAEAVAEAARDSIAAAADPAARRRPTVARRRKSAARATADPDGRPHVNRLDIRTATPGTRCEPPERTHHHG